MTEAMTATKRSQLVSGLREAAAWFEAHPEVPIPASALHITLYDLGGDEAELETLKTIARAMGAATKDYEDDFFKLSCTFADAVTVTAVAWRENVCQRIVVGTETVIEQRPPDGVEMVDVEVEREIVEWDCPPSLLKEAPSDS